MAVNHIDGTMFASVVIYPVAAGVGAYHAGTRWLTILFIPVGFALGIGIIYIGRKLLYAVYRFLFSCVSKIRPPWIQQVVAAPCLLLYFILPYAVVWGGILGIWYGSAWLVKHSF